MIFFTDQGYHGDIIGLTNLKQSPNKVKYYNALVHDGVKEKPLVCYNPDLYNLMQQAHTVGSPVTITNFHEKTGEFNDKPVLTLGQQSRVQYSTRPILFEHVKGIVEKMNHITSLHEVATKINVGQMVNVIAYIDLNNAELITVNTQYGVKKKLEAIAYGDSFSDHIKLTLWNTHVNSISESGAYKLQCLKVNSFNGKYLTTATATVIKQSKTDIQVKDIQTTNTFENVIFPPEILNLFEQSHFCKKCKRRAQAIGVFVTCTNCCSKSLLKNSESRFLVKATFMKEDEGKVILTMPHEIL